MFRDTDGVVRAWLSEERLAETEMFYAILDAYPVTRGHTLVISRRRCLTLFDLTEAEFADLHRVLAEVRRVLDERFAPDAYNVGANVGRASGQTVDWCHVHVIPRYLGDVSDPEGGVRAVIPERAAYRKRR